MLSTGKVGFLLYGPYTSLKAGTDQLTINGYANNVQSAWAEIFSKKDQRAFDRFDLAVSNKTDEPVFNTVFTLPSVVWDLEICVVVEP